MNKFIFMFSMGFLVIVAIVLGWNHKAESGPVADKVRVLEIWELPDGLEEVSGIAFSGKSRVACIQDEKGIIFIYDLKSSKIVKEIPFAGPGDYEGIAVSGSTAFVLRSDGSIFKVEEFLTDPKVEKWLTPLSRKQDVEGLYFEKEAGRLLLAIKEKDQNSGKYKGIYSFDLRKKRMNREPVMRIMLDHQVFKGLKEKKMANNFKPSEIHKDPGTGNYLLLEGESPKLLLLDKEGNPIKLYVLDKEKFPQPEGLAFDSEGNMFISNEGNPGTIYQVVINQNKNAD